MLFYFAWRIIRSFVNVSGRSRQKRETSENPYLNIEEADFEDITDKGDDKDQKQNSKNSEDSSEQK